MKYFHNQNQEIIMLSFFLALPEYLEVVRV